MAKKSGVIWTVLLGLLTGGTFLLGDDVYRELIKSRKRTREEDDPESRYPGRDIREITLVSLDGLRLHAELFCADEGNGKKDTREYAIVLKDAFATEEDAVPYVNHYLETGRKVLLPDARGCGKSEGAFIGYGYDDRLDVMSWIHWILKRDEKANILLHGLGTGAAAALFAGAEHLPASVYCMLSDSCYTSLSAYLERRLIRMPVKSALPVRVRLFLLRMMTRMRAGYDIRDVEPEKKAPFLSVPTLFLHGDADREVPVEMCRRLYNLAACTRQISIFLSAGHLESAIKDKERYWSQVDAFIKKHHPDRI